MAPPFPSILFPPPPPLYLLFSALPGVGEWSLPHSIWAAHSDLTGDSSNRWFPLCPLPLCVLCQAQEQGREEEPVFCCCLQPSLATCAATPCSPGWRGQEQTGQWQWACLPVPRSIRREEKGRGCVTGCDGEGRGSWGQVGGRVLIWLRELKKVSGCCSDGHDLSSPLCGVGGEREEGYMEGAADTPWVLVVAPVPFF